MINEHSPVIELAIYDFEAYHLLSALLNSSAALLWLKQICFNKGAGEAEERDRFELQPGKVQQLPLPPLLVTALQGKSNVVAKRLTALAEGCWERGCRLSTLALKKIFEKDGESYQSWNVSLSGYVQPQSRLAAPFHSTAELHENFQLVVEFRDKLLWEMIALQEEIDWLVYAAYNLLPIESPAVGSVGNAAGGVLLRREHRPFWLWEQAGGDYDKALNLIPEDWSAERKASWTARLVTIRDNEHIRRIEQPVYKRRWDEQWKVGNRWICGPVAYAAEFVDAFTWWLAEKAEWYLEHKAKAGPIELETWTTALWKDDRIHAAWPVIVDAIHEIESYKSGANNNKSKIDASLSAFARFFRELLKDETVPQGIPAALPWDQLEKKRRIPARVKSIRGKLNVPRERFHLTSDGHYRWAGKQ